jgi:hypothetical protein
MFGRLSYTWDLMRASWNVLKKDKALLVFPLMSAICCILVLASFAVPIFLADAWRPPTRNAAAAKQVIYYGTLFLYYFANYFVITFFNVGIIACAVERMRGGEPNLSFGFNAALSRLPLIVGWSLLSATVGLILRIIEDRSSKAGEFVAGLLGIAWGVASFLVVPVLVVERKGPFAALKDSAAMLKRTWGTRLAGGFGFGLIFILMAIPGFALIALAVYIFGSMHNIPLAVACGGLAIIYFLGLALVQSALQSIFQAAVYLYASGGALQRELEPQGFPVQLLQRAMVAK